METVIIIGEVGRISRDEEDSARNRQDERRFDGEFDGVQGNFVIHQAEYPRVCITGGTSLAVSSRPLMRSWLCLPSVALFLSRSLLPGIPLQKTGAARSAAKETL